MEKDEIKKKPNKAPPRRTKSKSKVIKNDDWDLFNAENKSNNDHISVKIDCSEKDYSSTKNTSCKQNIEIKIENSNKELKNLSPFISRDSSKENSVDLESIEITNPAKKIPIHKKSTFFRSEQVGKNKKYDLGSKFFPSF